MERSFFSLATLAALLVGFSSLTTLALAEEPQQPEGQTAESRERTREEKRQAALNGGKVAKAKDAKGADAEDADQKESKEGEQPEKPVFLRLVRDEDGKPLALQTSIVTYAPADPAKGDMLVELIGAVHIGEKGYYEALNKEFEKYDALLYELVAPENTRIPKERKGGPGSAVGGVQVGMKEMLELEFQLDRIDYTKENFVHADMSPEEFAKSMADRGESFSKMFFTMMGYGFAQQGKAGGKPAEVDLLMALFAKNRANRMKLIMAEQFDSMEGQMDILEGPEGSTILTERNRKAFEVLDRELKAGKKKLGVFYGAAHLPDMERRLVNDFGMQRKSERWIDAWNLRDKKD
jgi:hypothetical protein